MIEPKLDLKPTEIKFKRWRNKEHDYLVEVFQVLNFCGKHGYLTRVVVVREGQTRHDTWPAMSFLAAFYPVGRRLRRKSRWDRLREE